MKVKAYIIYSDKIVKIKKCKVNGSLMKCGKETYFFDPNDLVLKKKLIGYERIVFVDHNKRRTIKYNVGENLGLDIKTKLSSKLLTYYFTVLGLQADKKKYEIMLMIVVLGAFLVIAFMHYTYINNIKSIVEGLKEIVKSQSPLPPK